MSNLNLTTIFTMFFSSVFSFTILGVLALWYSTPRDRVCKQLSAILFFWGVPPFLVFFCATYVLRLHEQTCVIAGLTTFFIISPCIVPFILRKID